MRFIRALTVGSTAVVIAVAALMSLTPTPGQAMSEPIATDLPTSVVIPESSANTSLQPATSGAKNANAGNAEPLVGTTAQPSTPPTNADGSPKPPNEPKKDAPQLTVDTQLLEPGGRMVIAGSGFAPNEKVQVVVYSTPLVIGSFPADGVGALKASFLIPEQLRSGTHTIEATGWISRHVMNVEFTVVTAAVAAPLSTQLWILVVLGVLFTGAISLTIYFRRSIAQRFSGGSEPAGSAL